MHQPNRRKTLYLAIASQDVTRVLSYLLSGSAATGILKRWCSVSDILHPNLINFLACCCLRWPASHKNPQSRRRRHSLHITSISTQDDLIEEQTVRELTRKLQTFPSSQFQSLHSKPQTNNHKLPQIKMKLIFLAAFVFIITIITFAVNSFILPSLVRPFIDTVY